MAISTFGINHRESRWYGLTTYTITADEDNQHRSLKECQFTGHNIGDWVETTSDAIRYHTNRFDRDELVTYSDWTLPVGTRGTIRRMFTTLGHEFVTLCIDDKPYLIVTIPFAAIQAPVIRQQPLIFKQRLTRKSIF